MVRSKRAPRGILLAPVPSTACLSHTTSPLEARVRQLFAAEVANGTAPNDAAANALRRAQTEQLAAAAAERRRAAEAAAAAEAADASGAAAAAPPLERQPSVAAEGDTSFVRWEEVEQARHLVITHVHRAEGGAGASGRLLPTYVHGTSLTIARGGRPLYRLLIFCLISPCALYTRIGCRRAARGDQHPLPDGRVHLHRPLLRTTLGPLPLCDRPDRIHPSAASRPHALIS